MTRTDQITAAHLTAAHHWDGAAADAEQAGRTAMAAEYRARAAENRRLARQATANSGR